MVAKTVARYVFFDDILKSTNHKEPQTRKNDSDAEIITVVLISAGYFGGNIETTLSFVRSAGLMPAILGNLSFG
jgi:hypothetical protein